MIKSLGQCTCWNSRQKNWKNVMSMICFYRAKYVGRIKLWQVAICKRGLDQSLEEFTIVYIGRFYKASLLIVITALKTSKAVFFS